MQKNNWMSLAGLVLICTGLLSIAVGKPPADLYDHAGERLSTLLVLFGTPCTLAGLVLLVTAARRTTMSMAPVIKTKTNIGVGIGTILQLAAYLVSKPGTGVDPAADVLLLFLGSLPVFTWGCMHYAEGKGHSKWLGLAGVAGIFGLAILTMLPGQHADGGASPGEPDGPGEDAAAPRS